MCYTSGINQNKEKPMVVVILFVLGCAFTLSLSLSTVFVRETNSIVGAVAVPFMWLAAAVVAKYLGI